MHAVLRIDLQTRFTFFDADDFVDSGRAIAGFRAAIGCPVDTDRHRRIAQPQVNRLVFLMVGIGDEHRGISIERQFPIGFGIVDPRCRIGFHQGLVIGMRQMQGPGCFAAKDIGVDCRVDHAAPEAELGEAWTNVAHAVQFLVEPRGTQFFRVGMGLDRLVAGHRLRHRLGRQHAGLHRGMGALDFRHIEEPGGIAHQTAAGEGQLRQ